MSSAESGVMPSGWAGGKHVCIPGLGVGRILLEGPRVIEVALPAPECVVFLVDGRAVVLTDPRVPYARTLRAIAAARHIEESAAPDLPDELPVAVGDATPPAGMAAVATYPRLRAVRTGPRAPRG